MTKKDKIIGWLALVAMTATVLILGWAVIWLTYIIFHS
jgi:NhaP-type Na+/H+ or K+/H+ antiporter